MSRAVVRAVVGAHCWAWCQAGTHAQAKELLHLGGTLNRMHSHSACCTYMYMYTHIGVCEGVCRDAHFAIFKGSALEELDCI